MSDRRPGEGERPAREGRPVSLLMVATVSNTIRHFLLPYAAHFRALGWRVDVAAGGASTDPAVVDAFDNAYELSLSRSVLDADGLVRAVRGSATILDTRPDLVHVHTPIAAFLVRAAIRRLPADRRPAVAYTAHGFHFYEGGNPATNAAFRLVERVAGRWTDRLIVMNDEDEQAVRRFRIVPARGLVRMPGIGIDLARYDRDAVDPADVVRARAALGIGPGDPLFVVVAELTARKRVQDAIGALARQRDRRAHMALAGYGDRQAVLERLAAELGVRERVHFLGFVEDVRPLVCAANAVVLTSMREGLARSVMEALALGVPVIASTARGNRELLGTDGGILVPIGDVAGYARAMDLVAAEPERARAMAARGRARIVEECELARLVAMHEELYRSMLAERGIRAR